MSKIHDMTVGRPTRDILLFALPLVCGYILQQMYMVIDAAIVGQFLGVGALAAVGASSSIIFLIMGFANGSCSGFAIPVAQAFGSKNYQQMRRYVAHALRLTGCIALVLTVVTSALCTPILKMVNTPDAILSDAYTFLLLQFLAIPFTMAYNLFSCFIRALGNSKTPFFFLIFASMLNIILDVVFIVLLGLGVEGVGIATMLAQTFSAWLCWRYICRRLKLLLPGRRERGYCHDMAMRVLICGVPMGLQFSITGIGIIMLQGANNALGTVYVAAFTVAMRVKYLFTTVYENIGVAMATYCGQNIGAERVDRIAMGIRSAIKIMLIYFAFTFMVIYPFADEMMLLFVDGSQTEIVDNAARFMRICNYFYPVLGLLTIFRYSIQGLGYSMLSMMSGVMEMLARCSVSIWLVPAWGFLGVIYGDPVAWMAADLFLIPCFILLYRHLSRRVSTSA